MSSSALGTYKSESQEHGCLRIPESSRCLPFTSSSRKGFFLPSPMAKGFGPNSQFPCQGFRVAITLVDRFDAWSTGAAFGACTLVLYSTELGVTPLLCVELFFERPLPVHPLLWLDLSLHFEVYRVLVSIIGPWFCCHSIDHNLALFLDFSSIYKFGLVLLPFNWPQLCPF